MIQGRLKRVEFCGTSKEVISSFPPGARTDIGFQIGVPLMRARRRTGSSVFPELGFSPAASQELERKSELMVQVQNFVKRHGLTQAKAAMAFGISQPRVSQLVNGRLSQFSLDELVRLGERAGLDVTVKAEPNPRREKAIVSRVGAATTDRRWGKDAKAKPSAT